MFAPTSYPWFPVELVENIISEVWSSQLSNDDRITFMTSSLLVNKSWTELFVRITSKDVHIPCLPYLFVFLRNIESQSPIYPTHLLDQSCRTITIQLSDRGRVIDGHRMGKLLLLLTETLFSPFSLPNLEAVSCEYVNVGFDNILETSHSITSVWDVDVRYSAHAAPLAFAKQPPQICRLSISGIKATKSERFTQY